MQPIFSMQTIVTRLAEHRRTRTEAARTDPAYNGADVAPRPTVRMEVFDFGDEPPPGYSSPAPRRTGWERLR